MAVPVSSESGFTAGMPVPVAAAGQNPFRRGYGFIDATRDGRELLFARQVTDIAPRSPLNVLINWAPDASRYSMDAGVSGRPPLVQPAAPAVGGRRGSTSRLTVCSTALP